LRTTPESPRPSGMGRLPPAVAAVVATGLLALAAAGAAAWRSKPSGGDNPGRGWVFDVTTMVGTAALVIGLLAAAYAFLSGWLGSRAVMRERLHARPPWWQRLLSMLLILVVIGLTARGVAALRDAANQASVPAPPSAPPTVPGQAVEAAEPSAGFDWRFVAGGAALAVVAAAVFVVPGLRRSRTGRAEHDDAARSAVVAAVDRSLDALRAEPDSRRAVIAAYACMEDWMEGAGVGRADWEAPFEYLDRLLAEMGAPAAIAGSLTELFERAKFSRHVIGLDAKQQALDTLVELRTELERVA
jgi:hypothetical protein